MPNKTNPRFDAIVAAMRTATLAPVGYKRVRLPWWRALLRRRRYELRPITTMERLVERSALGYGGETWNEVKIERLTDA